MLVMRSFANLSATTGGRNLLVTDEMSEVSVFAGWLFTLVLALTIFCGRFANRSWEPLPANTHLIA
jgi:hypothetical protein